MTALTDGKGIIWDTNSFPMPSITVTIPSALIPSHLCLLLLYYIHLLFFGELPDSSNMQRPVTDFSDTVRFSSMMVINWTASSVGDTQADAVRTSVWTL